MKNKLIALLQELLEETDKVNLVGIKIAIMENSAFLTNPRTFGEISNVMGKVNSYIKTPNTITKSGIEELIQRINEKF